MNKYVSFLLFPMMLFGVSDNCSYSMDIQNNKPCNDVMFSEVINVMNVCDNELLGCLKGHDDYTLEERLAI